jgi:hypothetical protein
MNDLLLVLIIGSAVAALFVWSRRRHHGTVATARPLSRGNEDLARIARSLATRSWGIVRSTGFVLDPGALKGLGIEETVDRMLSHVRRIAQGIEVPFMTPRTVRLPVTAAAGVFRVLDGWVRIEVDPTFGQEPRAAAAILAHEACHYLLEYNGIREPDTLATERLTDVAVFVFGFGHVFLAGYRGHPGASYRPGHRLGYLTDAQYHFLDEYVRQIRAEVPVLDAGPSVLGRLWKAYPDKSERPREFQRARAQYPHLSDSEVVDRMLDEWARYGR